MIYVIFNDYWYWDDNIFHMQNKIFFSEVHWFLYAT